MSRKVNASMWYQGPASLRNLEAAGVSPSSPGRVPMGTQTAFAFMVTPAMTAEPVI